MFKAGGIRRPPPCSRGQGPPHARQHAQGGAQEHFNLDEHYCGPATCQVPAGYLLTDLLSDRLPDTNETSGVCTQFFYFYLILEYS